MENSKNIPNPSIEDVIIELSSMYTNYTKMADERSYDEKAQKLAECKAKFVKKIIGNVISQSNVLERNYFIDVLNMITKWEYMITMWESCPIDEYCNEIISIYALAEIKTTFIWRVADYV